jgi:class 3 adenylate cyclase
VTDTTDRSYWERLGDRAERTGVLETIENPIVIVVVAAIWSLGSALNSIVIAGMFFWFDEPVSGWISVTLSVLFVVGWFAFVATGNVSGIFMLFIAGSMVAVTAIQISMGGYANSGAFVMWGIGITIVATLLLRTRDAIAVGMVIAIAAIALGFAEQSLRASRAAPDPALPAVMFPYTLVAVLLLLMPALGFLVNRLSFERERAEGLLLNVLPAAVAAELKETGTTTARHYEAVSVLFADIVGFTPLSAEMEPEEMVNQLNDVFTYFDALADKYGVEKIRTIGDNYMVASGVPVPRDDHAQALCAMALEMLEYSETGPLSFRLGINSGPVVAGVIGTRKFQYDIWGDTVNTASRMESHGEPGKIQISQTTRDLITDHFATTPRGTIDVKGKGLLPTWWLEAPRSPIPA